MKAIREVLCCVLLFLYVSHAEKSRLVYTAEGPVRGFEEPPGIFAFYNIPYATAPTGDDKFRAPLPPPTWKEPLEAKGDITHPICPQPVVDFDFGKVTRQEDCLLASVYVPDTAEENLPVVAYIHGGGFQLGYGNMIKLKNFVGLKKVIVVTFNHRLGVHGFLCLGTVKAPGNAGLKDQLAFLRWVRRNIGNFGGNPYDVTLSGSSAGSMFTDLLQLSPATKGLFTKTIPESGSVFTPPTVEVDPIGRAKWFAKLHNFVTDDVYELEKFFLSASYDLLTSRAFVNELDSSFGFTPCVERATGEEMILDDTPENIIRSGHYNKVPTLYGYANMEGLMRMTTFDEFSKKMNEKFSDFLPMNLKFENEEQKEDVAKLVKEEYFGNKDVSENTMFGYVDYFTDIIFAYPAAKSVNLQYLAGNKDIYLYEYSFADVGGTPMAYKNYTTKEGANHGDQAIAVFDGNIISGVLDESQLTQEFKKMKSLMRDLWYNFVKTGKPVAEGMDMPAWPPMGANWSPHMSLGNSVELRDSLRLQRMDFWDQIYEKHGRTPTPPPAPPRRRTEL